MKCTSFCLKNFTKNHLNSQKYAVLHPSMIISNNNSKLAILTISGNSGVNALLATKYFL